MALNNMSVNLKCKREEEEEEEGGWVQCGGGGVGGVNERKLQTHIVH